MAVCSVTANDAALAAALQQQFDDELSAIQRQTSALHASSASADGDVDMDVSMALFASTESAAAAAPAEPAARAEASSSLLHVLVNTLWGTTAELSKSSALSLKDP